MSQSSPLPALQLQTVHPSSKPPYVDGSLLEMVLTDEQGSSTPIKATIFKTFLPFTFSQAMIVRFAEHEALGIPDQVVLKLYDRRFIERRPGVPPYESAADQGLEEALLAGQEKTLSSFPIDGFWPGTHMWERWMFEYKVWELGMFYFETERRAYRKLKEVQGKCVPTFFGTVTFKLGDSELEALSTVSGIAMEYIDAVSLPRVQVGVTISTEDAKSMYREALKIPEALEKCGVVHGDLHGGNILVRNSDKAPFIIDFGHSQCPASVQEVRAEGEVEQLKAVLGCWKTYDEERARKMEESAVVEQQADESDDLTELLGGRRFERRLGRPYAFVPSYRLPCNVFHLEGGEKGREGRRPELVPIQVVHLHLRLQLLQRDRQDWEG